MIVLLTLQNITMTAFKIFVLKATTEGGEVHDILVLFATNSHSLVLVHEILFSSPPYALRKLVNRNLRTTEQL